MRTSFYFEGLQRLGDRINDRISDGIKLAETGYSEPTINRILKALWEKSCIAFPPVREPDHCAA